MLFPDLVEHRIRHVQSVMDDSTRTTTTTRISDMCPECRQLVRNDLPELLQLVERMLDPDTLAPLVLKAQYGEFVTGVEEREACAELAKLLAGALREELRVERRPSLART